MSNEQQPVKVISSLIDSNFRVISPNIAQPPPGVIVDYPSLTPTIPNLEADYITMNQVANGQTVLLEQFMASFNKNTGGLPGDIEDFAAQYVNFLVQNGQIADTPATIKAAIKEVLDGFLSAFQETILFNNPTETGLLQALYPNLGTFGNGNTDDPDQYTMISAVWKQFSENYVYQPDGSIANSSTTAAQGFFQQMRSFTAITATIRTGITKLVNTTTGTANAVTNKTPSFEEAFYGYFPTLTQPSPIFDLNFQQFSREMIKQYGFVSASRQYTQWVNYVQDIANVAPAATPTLPTQSVSILNDVFFLIVQMIGSIQNIAASQANRLTLYTSWQKGYTDLLNQVPVFTASSKDLLRDDAVYGDTKQKRQDEQGNFNAGITQQITAYKDTVSEDAKALQSRVNASSDAFNEQANTATAILQSISTILSAIFR